MEVRSSIHNRLCILCHLTVQYLGCRTVHKRNCIKVTCPDTSSTANTMFKINRHLSCISIINQAVIRTLSQTALTSSAGFLIDRRLTNRMLILLTGSGTTSHSDILDRTAETCRLMPFKMRQTDKYIRIHHGTSDLRFLYVLSSLYRNFNIIRSLQAVSDNHRTSDTQRCKSILPCTVKMLQCVLSTTRI